jgi:hypothetical protein
MIFITVRSSTYGKEEVKKATQPRRGNTLITAWSTTCGTYAQNELLPRRGRTYEKQIKCSFEKLATNKKTT